MVLLDCDHAIAPRLYQSDGGKLDERVQLLLELDARLTRGVYDVEFPMVNARGRIPSVVARLE